MSAYLQAAGALDEGLRAPIQCERTRVTVDDHGSTQRAYLRRDSARPVQLLDHSANTILQLVERSDAAVAAINCALRFPHGLL